MIYGNALEVVSQVAEGDDEAGQVEEGFIHVEMMIVPYEQAPEVA
jgi:hypothetical protein